MTKKKRNINVCSYQATGFFNENSQLQLFLKTKQKYIADKKRCIFVIIAEK